ncbi:MAG TPA: hypothetical protein VFF67_04025 [Thermoplasmata archaeon]|nr:hypothetical protein [Thermoplasmata archaeon]
MVRTGTVHPPPLAGSSMAFDPKDGYVVLFGGHSNPSAWGSANVTNATWTYSAGIWTRLHVGAAPRPRADASIAYDPLIGAVVLFGGVGKTTCTGRGCSTPEFNDTWTFVGGRWTLLRSATSPPARFGAGMTFDPKVQALILEAGITNGNASDTWRFSGGVWSHVAQNCTSVQPPWSRGVVSAYDRGDRVLVALTDYGPAYTFLFSKGCWTQYNSVASSTPPGALSFDPILNRTVFFTSNNTWSYAAGVWSSGLTTRSPTDRSYEPIMAFDAADRCMLLFGAGSTSAQTWVLK